MKLKLRGKLLLPSFSVILLGMALAGWLSYRATKSALETLIEAQVAQVSSSLAQQIDGFLDDAADVITLMGKRDITLDLFPSDGTALHLCSQPGQRGSQGDVRRSGQVRVARRCKSRRSDRRCIGSRGCWPARSVATTLFPPGYGWTDRLFQCHSQQTERPADLCGCGAR